MKGTIFIAALLALGFSITACAPVTITKTDETFTYDESGRVKKHYTESIVQVAPQTKHEIHLNNVDMYK